MQRTDLELKLRTRLRAGFGLYDKNHWVFVLEKGNNVYVAYWHSSNGIERQDKSGFDIQITEGICYILIHVKISILKNGDNVDFPGSHKTKDKLHISRIFNS